MMEAVADRGGVDLGLVSWMDPAGPHPSSSSASGGGDSGRVGRCLCSSQAPDHGAKKSVTVKKQTTVIDRPHIIPEVVQVFRSDSKPQKPILSRKQHWNNTIDVSSSSSSAAHHHHHQSGGAGNLRRYGSQQSCKSATTLRSYLSSSGGGNSSRGKYRPNNIEKNGHHFRPSTCSELLMLLASAVPKINRGKKNSKKETSISLSLSERFLECSHHLAAARPLMLLLLNWIIITTTTKMQMNRRRRSRWVCYFPRLVFNEMRKGCKNFFGLLLLFFFLITFTCCSRDDQRRISHAAADES